MNRPSTRILLFCGVLIGAAILLYFCGRADDPRLPETRKSNSNSSAIPTFRPTCLTMEWGAEGLPFYWIRIQEDGFTIAFLSHRVAPDCVCNGGTLSYGVFVGFLDPSTLAVLWERVIQYEADVSSSIELTGNASDAESLTITISDGTNRSIRELQGANDLDPTTNGLVQQIQLGIIPRILSKNQCADLYPMSLRDLVNLAKP